MSAQLATYWSVTINNPTENDYVIVRQPHTNHIREIVWTPEVGEDGTPHIQAFVRLQRNATMGMMKKLYPRAHLKPAVKDDYILNAERYAQKNDATTVGAHTITLVDPIPAVDTLLYRVLSLTLDADGCGEDGRWSKTPSAMNFNRMLRETKRIEDDLVTTEARLEKLFLSPSYDRMKRRFWEQIMTRMINKRQIESTEIVLPVNTKDGEASSCGTDQEEEQEGSEGSQHSGLYASEDDSSEQGTDAGSDEGDEQEY